MELSVFGRGFGEAICVHVGGEWMLIDSCLNPETGEPAGLEYLSAMSIPPEAVSLILITHWDDDHVAGIDRCVDVYGGATVACSMALRSDDFIQFVLEQEQARGRAGSGVDELRAVLLRCRSTDRLVWAQATRPLHPRGVVAEPVITALSPSDDAVSRSIEALVESATGKSISFRRRYRAPEGPNGASVAAFVRADNASILLGADLENSPNPATGWEAVLSHARPDRTATAVKVPHHASEGAHHDGVWDELIERESIAIVTPWSVGGNFLPLAKDLDRLHGVAQRVFLTALPRFRTAQKDSRVEKFIRIAGVRVRELRGWGHVRARRRVDETSWRVELAGDAQQIPEPA